MERVVPSVTSRRLSAEDRRESIVRAAAFVFAERGFAGANTLDIAKRAGISEALIYRHFESKEALYEAVLEWLLHIQDERIGKLFTRVPDTRAYAVLLRSYLENCLAMRDGQPEAISQRVVMASLASDGKYAGTIYRRALRKRRADVAVILKRAFAAGEISGEILDASNAFLFIEHIGTMLSLNQIHSVPVIPYTQDKNRLLEDALLFCLRGLGLPVHYAARPEPEVMSAVSRKRPSKRGN